MVTQMVGYGHTNGRVWSCHTHYNMWSLSLSPYRQMLTYGRRIPPVELDHRINVSVFLFCFCLGLPCNQQGSGTWEGGGEEGWLQPFFCCNGRQEVMMRSSSWSLSVGRRAWYQRQGSSQKKMKEGWWF